MPNQTVSAPAPTGAQVPCPVPQPQFPDQPLVCHFDPNQAGLESALTTLPGTAFPALGDPERSDLFELAKGIFELGMPRPAVAFLELELRIRGPRIGSCELMGKCLLALDQPELAMLWFVWPMRNFELDGDATFEFVRLASLCQMQKSFATPCRGA